MARKQIFVDFFNEVGLMISSLQKVREASLENIKLTKPMVEHIVEINRDLDELIVKIETLDHAILTNTVIKTEDEKKRYEEYKYREEMINTFLPSMIAYSIVKGIKK